MSTDLSTVFTGLKFDNPFLLSSAPPTESESNIMRAFEAGWGGVVTKTIGMHPVVNVAGPKTKFLRYYPETRLLSMNKGRQGTLVASYNRGIKLVNLCGGVKVSVVGDAMQRAPVFVFDDARQGREFAHWVKQNIATIREEAESSSSVAKLIDVDTYLASKFVYLRFNAGDTLFILKIIIYKGRHISRCGKGSRFFFF